MPRHERTGRLPHIILYPIAVFDGPALARPPVAAPAPPLRDMTPFVHLGSDGPRPLGPGELGLVRSGSRDHSAHL